jgi:CBS domain-containing protein
MSRTGGVGLAHYAPGEFIFHKGDAVGSLFAIQSGTAGVYLDEALQPATILKPGEHFGAGSLSANERGIHLASVKAETPLDLITLGRNDFDDILQTVTSLRVQIQRSASAVKGYESLMAMSREHPHLASVTVAEAMSSPAETLSPDTSLREAVKRFHGGKPGYPVVDGGRLLIGYCGRAELFNALRMAQPFETQVKDFMRKDPPVISDGQSLIDASVAFLREEIEMLPVVRSDGSRRIVGVVSPLDVILRAIEPLERDLSLGSNVRPKRLT